MNPYFMFQKDSGQGGIPTIPKKPILIVLFGESNSGGIAPNASAQSLELAPRKAKILNNNTLEFEPLDIGTNNLIGHLGLESYWYNSHGMELQIANLYDNNYFNNLYEIFIVKAGAGGSKVSEWQTGGNYYNTFKTRVQTAIDLIFQNDPINVRFMLSLGINDKLAGTSTSVYKTGLKTLINNIKTDLNFPKIKMKLMLFDFVTSSAVLAYNTQILEVAKETYINVFDTQGCSVLGDGNHLDYFGMKLATNKFILDEKNIVCDGNSLTQGQGGTTSYPQYLSGMIQNSSVQNFGVGGQTTQQMEADAVTQIDTQINLKKENILIAWEIGNDVYYNGNVQDACQRFKDYCLNRKQNGWQKIIILNCPPRKQGTQFGDSEATYNQKLIEINQWLSNNYSSFADELIDLANDARFQNYSPLVYSNDFVHYVNNGYNIIAQKIKEVIN